MVLKFVQHVVHKLHTRNRSRGGGGKTPPKSKMVHRHGTAAPCEHGDFIILLSIKTECLLNTVSPNTLTRLYRFSNDIPVHSISTGCPALTQSRWAPSCHTWRRTNRTWQKWVGISVLLIKMERAGKTFLRGQSIKEKAWGRFHSCFAHWPESTGVAGNGVIVNVEARSSEGHFRLFRVLKKYTSRTAHIHRAHSLSFGTQTQTQFKHEKEWERNSITSASSRTMNFITA